MATKRQLGSSEENWTKCAARGTGIGIFAVALNQVVETQSVLVAAKAVCETHAILRSQVVNDSKSSKKLSFEVRNGGLYAPVVESLPWPELGSVNDSSGVLLLPNDTSEEHMLSIAVHAIVTNELNFLFQKSDTDFPVDIFQVHLYNEPSSTACVVVLRFHSGAVDRHSCSVAASEFLGYLDEVVANGKCGSLRESKDGNGIFPCMEDLVPKKASKSFFKKGLDVVGYALNAGKSALLPFHPGFLKSPSSPFRSEILSYSLGKPATEGLLEACNREKTTLAGALSAAFLQTAANVKELKEKKQDTFSISNVLDCRSYFEPPLDATVLGNYSSGLPLDQQAKENMSFWELARQVSASTEKSISKNHQFSELPVLNMLFSQVLKHPNITPNASGRTALFTVFVDGPMKAIHKVNNLKLAGTIGPIASMHFVGACFSVAEALLDGPDLSLTFIYTVPLYARQQLQSLLASAIQLLKSPPNLFTKSLHKNTLHS